MRKCRNCLCRTCIKSCKCHNCKGKIKECKRYTGFRQLSIFEPEPKEKMRVLVACEESQRVCIEFRRLGHEAYSCDIEPCSGGHDEWHIQEDVLPLLNGNCEFMTADGAKHKIVGKWDMIIAFPPCTYLTVAGNRWFDVERYGDKAVQRYKNREKAIKFFMQFANADCERIAIENPVGIMSTEYRKPDQIIQPWMFGHNASKGTCLWLKGLPKLHPTDIIQDESKRKENQQVGKDGKLLGFMTKNDSGKIMRYNDPETAKIRSKTFHGIAKAMAEQWGGTADPQEPKYQKAPRYPWSYYGITKDRYKQLTEYIQSGRYTDIASRAAKEANNDIAEYILLSVTKDKSYDELKKKWELREIERMACGRSDFYGYRRYFYHLFNLEVKKINA